MSDEKELRDLRRWKAEASEVMIGLQDLGRALDMPPGTRITGELAAEKARALVAEVNRLKDESPYVTCGCGRTIYLAGLHKREEALAALADRMETADYNSLADGWGCIAAAEIRHELGLEPECRCPWNTNPATDRTKP